MKPYYKNELTTIYNGDCLEVMDHLIEQGIKVDAVITDPPYGTIKNNGYTDKNTEWDIIIPFEEMWERLLKIVKPNAPVILFSSRSCPIMTGIRLPISRAWTMTWSNTACPAEPPPPPRRGP